MIYAEKLKDPRWQKLRLEIFQRDEWKCVSCGCGDMTLHVHHLRYEPGKEPWEYHWSMLVTLCERHHGTMHDRMQAEMMRGFFESITRNMDGITMHEFTGHMIRFESQFQAKILDRMREKKEQPEQQAEPV